MVIDIRHTGLVVEDIDRMKNFYIKIGFKVFKELIEEGDFISKVTGYKDVKIKTIKMTCQNESKIELIKYYNPSSKKIKNNYEPNKLGCSHVAMTVKNANDTCKIITENGGTIINEPSKNNDHTVKVAYCYDPEGILLEIVEELK